MDNMNGKKRLLIGLLSIFVLAVVVLFCCDITITEEGETKETEVVETVDPLDKSALELFDTGKGLTIKMSSDMEEERAGDLSVYYFAEDCMVSVKKVPFDELVEAGTANADSTIEDYIKLIEDSNENITFTTDSYGHPSTTYSAESDGVNVAYYVTVRKGSDAFWMINFSCLEEEKETRYPQYELWGSTIEVN